MKKIAFVVQRYGLEVNGGAELHCRQLAEHMAKNFIVEVITTKAVGYVTWEDSYKSDVEEINGITVRRFSVKKKRNNKKFNKLSERILQYSSSKEDELVWMKEQGPYSTELIQYIRNNKDSYDIFIFFTYLYYTTFFGLQEVNEKAILIPTAHDEPPIYLSIFNDFFKLPKGIFYNTFQEKKFIEHKFHNEYILNNDGLGGVGVEVPIDISGERFCNKYKLHNFVLYIGRIEENKGCKDLFKYFREYKRRNKSEIKLVLIGKEMMRIPEAQDIVSLGFVEEQDKFDALAACNFLILPSLYESLSMVVLEAMSVKKTVLVNGKCDVLREHCIKSNGGLYYTNYYEFEGCMNYLSDNYELICKLGENGKKYVNENYAWKKIEERLSEMITKICGSKD